MLRVIIEEQVNGYTVDALDGIKMVFQRRVDTMGAEAEMRVEIVQLLEKFFNAAYEKRELEARGRGKR